VKSKKRVVVLGLMGQYPLGGMAWQVLHHVLGFRRLGYETYYVENNGAPPYSPKQKSIVGSCAANVRFLRDTFARFDLGDAWAYYDSGGRRWFGMAEARAKELLRGADLLVNLCGAAQPHDYADRKGCLVYVETDPILEQVKYANGDAATKAFLEGHDVLFTYAVRLGDAGTKVPPGPFRWRKTHPPVCVDLWASPPRPRAPWRTIATYRNKGKDVVIGGETYFWSKHPNWDLVMELPRRTQEKLEVALVSPDSDQRARFEGAGWRVEDPVRISCGALVYRKYIQGAKGEFSVEKDDQVRLHLGWFSDRSVCFLAAGRPVVIQDTGFGARVPTDAGLLGWSTAEEALACVERASKDYALHAKRARAIAREHFEASVLLPPILEAAGV
jgi:hypothetical protein